MKKKVIHNLATKQKANINGNPEEGKEYRTQIVQEKEMENIHPLSLFWWAAALGTQHEVGKGQMEKWESMKCRLTTCLCHCFPKEGERKKGIVFQVWLPTTPTYFVLMLYTCPSKTPWRRCEALEEYLTQVLRTQIV